MKQITSYRLYENAGEMIAGASKPDVGFVVVANMLSACSGAESLALCLGLRTFLNS